MPQRQNASFGVDNPWYPEGGPGRHLKARLQKGDLLIGPMLGEYARPSLVKLFQHAGFDFIYIEYEHTFFGLADLADTILSARDNGLPVIAKTPQLERMEVAKAARSRRRWHSIATHRDTPTGRDAGELPEISATGNASGRSRMGQQRL